MNLKIKDLSYTIGQLEILNKINVEICEGEFVGIIGPNGSGKSTLLKNIYKMLKPNHGAILLHSKNLLKMSNKEVAKELAVVAQESESGFDFTVEEIVLMGRHPYKRLFETTTEEDYDSVDDALQKVGMLAFKERSFVNLSGGEKQRVLIARALAQATDLLILDEPTNHLDIGYQMHIMDLIKSFNKTTLAAIHDLNLAAMYCDRVFIIKKGNILDYGVPKDILTRDMIKDLFNIDTEVTFNKRINKVQINLIPGMISH